MNKRFFLTFLLAYACMSMMQAICYEKLYLKCGIVVEGNITSQELGKTVTFSVQRVHASVKSESIELRDSRIVKESELDDIWKTYFEETPSAVRVSEYTFSNIHLMDISKMKDHSANDSKKISTLVELFPERDIPSLILEEGSIVKFVCATTTPVNRIFDLSDIRSIKYHEQDPLAVNGVEDEVETKDKGTLKGFILEKVLGESIRMKTNDGRILNIKNSNIVSQKKNALNKELPLYKQVPFLDEIKLKDKNIHTGVISFQKSDKSDSFLLLTTPDNEEPIPFKIKDIAEIRTVFNDDYQPQKDVLVENDSVYFNHHAVKPIMVEKGRRDIYTLDEDQVKDILFLKMDEINGVISIAMKNNDINQSFILSPLTDSRIGSRQDYSYKMEDLLFNYIHPKDQYVSRNDTLYIIYEVKKGAYIFFNRKNKISYFFIIE